MIEAVTFRPYSTGCSLFTTGRLSDQILLTLHETLIRSIITSSTSSENLRQTSTLWNLRACKTRLAVRLTTLQGAQLPAICIWLSELRVCMILSQNYEDSQQESHRAMKIKILATLIQMKPSTENIRGFNLMEVILMSVTLIQLPLEEYII